MGDLQIRLLTAVIIHQRQVQQSSENLAYYGDSSCQSILIKQITGLCVSGWSMQRRVHSPRAVGLDLVSSVVTLVHLLSLEHAPQPLNVAKVEWQPERERSAVDARRSWG